MVYGPPRVDKALQKEKIVSVTHVSQTVPHRSTNKGWGQ